MVLGRWISSLLGVSEVKGGVADLATPQGANTITTRSEIFARLRRSSGLAHYRAAKAVKSGVKIGEFLRARLAEYRRAAPRFSYPLPEFVLNGVDLLITWPSDRRHPIDAVFDDPSSPVAASMGDLAAETRFAIATRDAAGDHIATEMQSNEDEAAAVVMRQRESEELRTELSTSQREQISSGTMMSSARFASRKRRRQVSLLLILAPLAILIALLVGEIGWNCFTALADSAGIDSTNLRAEWTRNQIGIIGWSVGSLVLAALGCVLADQWFQTVRSLSSADHATSLLTWAKVGLLSTVLFGFLFFLSWLRRDFSSAASSSDEASAFDIGLFAFFFINAISLAGGAILTRVALSVAGNRRRELQLLSDLDRPALDNFERSAEAIASLDRELAGVRRQQELIRRRREQLEQSAQRGEQHLRLIARTEQHAVESFVDEVKAAFEADRLNFIRYARQLKCENLLEEPPIGPGGSKIRRRKALALTGSNLVVFCAVMTLMGGCSTPPTQPVEPLQIIFAPSGATMQTDARAAEAVVEEWLTRAVTTPGAQVSVWSATGKGHHTIKVPSSWGRGALRRKASFVRSSRESLRQFLHEGETSRRNEQGLREPDDSQARLIVIGSDVGEPLKRSLSSLLSRPPAPPVHTAVICDRSSSARACTGDALVRAFDEWLKDGGVAASSSFEVWRSGRSLPDTSRLISIRTSNAATVERVVELLRLRSTIREVLPERSDADGSAIPEALHVAGRALSDRKGTKRILLISDLRAITGPFNFERSVPAQQEFIDWLAAEKLLINLKSTQISVCGVHHFSTDDRVPTTARTLAELQELWIDAFAAMDVANVRIVTECDEAMFDAGRGGTR